MICGSSCANHAFQNLLTVRHRATMGWANNRLRRNMEKWWEMHHPTTICGAWGKFRTKNPIIANKQQPMCHPIRTPAGVRSARWQSPGQRWLLFGERLRDYSTVVHKKNPDLIIQIRIGLFQSQPAWWWGFIILNDCFMTKCVADSHASTQCSTHTPPWENSGTVEDVSSTRAMVQLNRPHKPTKQSVTVLIQDSNTLFKMKFPPASKKWSMILVFLALVWWSCVYFTYQTNQNIWLKMRFNMQLLVACMAWQNPTINQSQWEPQPEKVN